MSDPYLAQMLRAKPNPFQESLTSYEPTWRDRAKQAAMALGFPAESVEGMFGKGLIGDDTGLVDMTPAGFPLALDDIHRSGNKTNLAINTVAALPIPGARMLKDAVEPVVKKGIRAFHGSPHDFDKFDMSKIGTGEGAQAYGHGLYFAENEGVAREYKNTLERSSRVSGVPISGLEGAAESYLYKAGGNVDTAIKEASDELARLRKSDKKIDSMRADGAQKAIVKLQAWKSTNAVAPAGAGRMYEASINASPDEFLDWDKPLGQQSEAVKAALRKAGYDTDNLPRTTKPATGQTVVQSWDIGNKSRVAEDLRAAGIKGVRYRDANSRNPGFSSLTPEQLDARIASLEADIAGGGGDQVRMKEKLASMQRDRDSYRNITSNYVVFDDSIIDILRKYGIAGLIGGGAAAGVATQDYGNGT